MKKPKVVEKKLGQHKAVGMAYNDKNDKNKKDRKKFGIIEIDPRLEVHGGNKGYMDTFIHEAIHMIDPILHEDDVTEMANKLTSILWEHGYRRVYL